MQGPSWRAARHSALPRPISEARFARPIAFNCGVELVAPFDVSAESPTLQRAKLESMQRKVTERRTAEQAEHVARAAELLKQFQSLRDAAPGLSPGRVLERISPADRGSMLETLLMASAAEAGQTLYAVAGPNLVRIDSRQSAAPKAPSCDVIPLPGDLGPLRSVQAAEIEGRTGLLIGAQSGVMFVDPTQPAAAVCYADREVTSALGFNSVYLKVSSLARDGGARCSLTAMRSSDRRSCSGPWNSGSTPSASCWSPASPRPRSCRSATSSRS